MNSSGAVEPYQAFYRKVELHWSLARGCQIIVSPIEFEAIESWYEAGIPLAVVTRAIDLFIEKKKNAKRQRSFLLKDANNTVQKCFKEYESIHEAQGEEQTLLHSKMKGLIKKVKAVAKKNPDQSAYMDGIVDKLQAIKITDIVAFDDVDTNLNALEQEMVAHFQRNMDAEIAKEIREDIEDLLTEDEDPEFFNKMLIDSVRNHFQLPKLTLLG